MSIPNIGGSELNLYLTRPQTIDILLRCLTRKLQCRILYVLFYHRGHIPSFIRSQMQHEITNRFSSQESSGWIPWMTSGITSLPQMTSNIRSSRKRQLIDDTIDPHHHSIAPNKKKRDSASPLHTCEIQPQRGDNLSPACLSNLQPSLEVSLVSAEETQVLIPEEVK